MVAAFILISVVGAVSATINLSPLSEWPWIKPFLFYYAVSISTIISIIVLIFFKLKPWKPFLSIFKNIKKKNKKEKLL